MRHIGMEEKFLGMLLLTAAGSLISIVIVIVSTRRLVNTADWVSHTYQVIGSIEATRAGILEAQQALYRYTITDNSRLLNLEETGLKHVEEDDLQLRQLTSDNPIEIGHLQFLDVALTHWRSRLKDVESAMHSKGFTAVQRMVNEQYIASDTTLFPILDAMHTEEERLLRLRLIEEHRSTYWVDFAYLTVCLLAIFFLFGLYLQIRREIAERRKLEVRFQTLFETAADAIIVSDMEGKVIMANEEVMGLLGYMQHEIVGQSVDILVPEQSRNQHLQHRATYTAAPVTRRMGRGMKLFAQHKSGTKIPVDINLSTLLLETGMVVVSRIRDMTEHQHAEDKIRELNLHLEARASELESVNQELEAFSYSVSHDLRAPLRAIDGFSSLLAEHCHGRLDEEANRLLNVVRDNSKKMRQLIDDLLSFSRLGRKTVNKARFGMRDLVDEALKEITAENATLAVTIDIPTLPDAWGDRALLKQVWINLLSNAIKYSANVFKPRIEIEGHASDVEVIYCVRDHGVGFNMRYAHKLFVVFQRLHGEDQFPGTGVGLAIVKRIIVKHGGRVWAESTPGQGASFYFSLPIEEGRA